MTRRPPASKLKAAHLTATVPAGLKDELDRFLAKYGRSRSSVIQSALVNYLALKGSKP